MSVYYSFQEQRQQDASLTIKAMGIQLGINVGTAAAVMIGFSLLRPKNSLVYAPKLKFSSDEHKPPVIESKGWFSWIKTIWRVSDEELLQKVGCDALLYIRFVRLLRKLLFVLSVIGVGALIPIYVVGTKATGDWPPPSGSIEILSLSGINLQDGKLRSDPTTTWYWAPFAATWLFSIIIAYFMYRASCDYIDLRQHYFRLPENDVSMKSLIVSHVPTEMRSDGKLKEWVESTQAVTYSIKEAMIGHHSSKLSTLFEEHEEAVRQLETTLASYLSDGKNTDSKKRPVIRVNGFLGCIGGRKVDAIEYYTKRVSELEKEIKTLRQETAKVAPYGWISFDKIEYAHATERSLKKWSSKTKNTAKLDARLSPTPKNIVWNNLPLEEKTKLTKRWVGRVVYIIFVFVWMIPVGILSATSNVINFIRLIPNSASFISSHEALMAIIQAYFTPIIMALFFYVLPFLFRFLSQQQGYITQTTLDRKVLVKLYVFFIINNLLVFTLTSIFIGIYGQLKALVESGTLPDNQEVSGYIMQIAKNISDVSSFWINYVCIKSLGLTMDLAMLVPLLTITLKKFFTRPSPRALREMAKPPEFNFPQHYNLLLFFFTIALIYSAMSPLVLPFALVYFCVASMVYKYMLMYVYVTKIESGGKIWPVIFQTIMTSVILFQVVMIIMLALKGGLLQCYITIPLPFLTMAFQYFYYRRMHTLGSYLIGTDSNMPSHYVDENFMGAQKKKKKEKSSGLASQFQDPGYNHSLSAPTVHEDVKHLLSKVYHTQSHDQDEYGASKHNKFNETVEMAHTFSKRVAHDMDLNSKKGFDANKRMTILDRDDGMAIKFQTLSENEIVKKGRYLGEDDDEDEDEDEEMELKNTVYPAQAKDEQKRSLIMNNAEDMRWNQEHDLKRHTSTSSSNHSSSLYRQDTLEPLLPSPAVPQHENFYSPGQLMPPGMIGPARQLQNERSVTSEYYEMYSSFTPNASAANLEEMPTKRDSYYFNGNTNSEVRPVSLQEFGFEEEEESAKKEALERRHTAPLEATLVDVSLIDTRNESQRRHQSLPTYTAALANINIEGDSEEEEEEEDEKQQDEEWIFNTALPKRTVTRSTSVRDEKQQHVRLPQRSKTMAARTIQSYENPFQSDTEKDHSSLHSDDEESSDDDDDDKKPSDSPTDYRSHYDGPF